MGAANNLPIYGATPNATIGLGNAVLVTANTALDGTGTVVTAITAGTNGAYIPKIRFSANGSNVQTVARVFLNNGNTNGTATNNIKIAEITLNLTTASANSALQDQDLVLNLAIPAGWKLNLTIGTTVAGGWWISTPGALDY